MTDSASDTRSAEDIASTVRVEPDLPKGGDAVEWIEKHSNGDLVGKLLEAIEAQAVEPDPPATATGAGHADRDLREHDEEVFAEPKGTELSDDALALELGLQWRDEARFVDAWGHWYFFRERRWRHDDRQEYFTLGREFLNEKADEVLANAELMAARVSKKEGKGKLVSGRKAANVLRSKAKAAAVLTMARSNRLQAAVVNQWDADPLLLGTPEGTVDLRTGELHEADPNDYITKQTAVPPAPTGTPHPLLDEFLDRVTANDRAVAAYLRRLVGYSLTGVVTEHVLAFLYGTGANGKTVFINTILGVSGGYAATFPPEMLMVSRHDRHPTELARLRGVRLAVGSETEVGRSWAESKVKALTGGDRIAARFMHRDFFEFDPAFQLVVVGNHKPALRGVDEAIRRRLHLIPFTVTIPPKDRDPKLVERLRQEWPAILRWAINGCLEWQQKGLAAPDVVKAATEEYLEAEDAVGSWLAESTAPDPQAWRSTSDLYASWKSWAEANGEFVISQKRLSQALTDRGIEALRKHDGRGFLGLRLHRSEEKSI